MKKMVNKNGQVTIFIIIALLLVVAVGIVFVVKNNSDKTTITAPAGTENIQDFVEQCLKNTAENGLVLIGRQGGYYAVPSPSIFYSGNDSESGEYYTELSSITVPYYWDGSSSNNMPSIQIIESQLSLYVQGNLDNCLNNFSAFKQKGFDVQAGEIKTETNILNEKVIVSLDYPVTIKKADITQTKTAYSAEVPVRLGLIYNLTENMIFNHTACPPVSSTSSRATLNLNCFNVVRLNNFNIALIRLDNTALFVLTDNEYKLNNTYYDFIFAYNYL